jgi:hypothetical protein
VAPVVNGVFRGRTANEPRTHPRMNNTRASLTFTSGKPALYVARSRLGPYPSHLPKALPAKAR